MPRSPRRIMTGDRGSPMPTAFENPFLIARQRPGKSVSFSGNVHRQCTWSGSTTQASIWKGARARTRRTASRNASICVTSKSDRRSSRFTVKKNVPPGTRLRRYSGTVGLCPAFARGGRRCAFPPYPRRMMARQPLKTCVMVLGNDRNGSITGRSFSGRPMAAMDHIPDARPQGCQNRLVSFVWWRDGTIITKVGARLLISCK